MYNIKNMLYFPMKEINFIVQYQWLVGYCENTAQQVFHILRKVEF